MEISKAINVAVSCIMASHLEMDEKREVIETLRRMEDAIETISDAIEGQRCIPLVVKIGQTLSELGIYDKV